MNAWTLRFLCSPRVSVFATTFVVIVATAVGAQRPEPRPKTVHGTVQDLRGTGISGARVFIRNMEENVIQILTTGEGGRYSLGNLPPRVDYEIYAEFRGTESRKRVVSSFLNRPDNLLNFKLDIAMLENETDISDDDGPKLKTFDLVQIQGSFELPDGIPAPIPGVLLLHGYGESHSVWSDLRERLLRDGWAVLAIDLRGHGRSRSKNGEPIEAREAWRRDARQFPLDVGPALEWLKSQTRLDSKKIVVIGNDVGANLALIASGRFSEVGTAVAINPNLDEALSMAGSAQDFTPRSALLMVSEQAMAQGIRNYITGPSRVNLLSAGHGTAAVLATGSTIDEIIRWLKDVY